MANNHNVTFTPITIGILIAAALSFALSGLSPPLLVAAIVIDAALFIILLADYALTEGPESIEVEREADEKLSLGIPNPVLLKIHNRSGQEARLHVRDEPPYLFEMEKNEVHISLAPYAAAEHRYRIIPHARGDFSFGDIYVRRRGILGMHIREHRIPAAADIKVYPDISLISLRARRRGGTIPEGRRRFLIGGGTEFESLRDYRPDDEFRNIDWKATARRGELTSRNYQIERSQNVLILIDAGRTMGIASEENAPHASAENTAASRRRFTRLDFAVNAACALSLAAVNSGDQVGLMVFSGEVEIFIPPRKGRSNALAILQALYAARSTQIESDYSGALLHLSRRWRKRSLIVLLTDLVDPDSSGGIITHLSRLARTQLVVCIAISDARILEAAESLPNDVSEAYRKAVARQVLLERRKAMAKLEHAGVVVVDTSGPKAPVQAVEAYLGIKARGRL